MTSKQLRSRKEQADGKTRQTTAKATSNVASEKPVTKTKAKAIPRPRAKAPITSAPALETVLLGTPEAAVHPATPNTEATPPPQTRQVLANDSTNSRGAKATNNRLPTSSQPAAKKRERGAPSAKADAKAKKAKANEQVEQLQDEMVQHWRAYEDNDEAAVARETAQAIRRLSDIAETSLIDFDVAQVLQNQAEYEAVDNNSSNEGSAASGKQGFVSKSFG
ncbi:hypothetical protein BKA70DRAFT_1417506 [Coprinopsis sp. MPI-PUGE-AT-0042]|nr:hypothetical protein BKA70DRAFT_1417506 [Coprinopsis sp. MPI-PUGE-AT-0042]